MRSIRSAILVAVVLCGAADAWGATDEEAFLAVLKKFGVTDNGLTSKKPCLCVGGPADGQTGRLAIFRLGDRYHHECRIPFFNPQGGQMGSASCLALGGAIEVLSK
jgi:hypothetical protein